MIKSLCIYNTSVKYKFWHIHVIHLYIKILFSEQSVKVNIGQNNSIKKKFWYTWLHLFWKKGGSNVSFEMINRANFLRTCVHTVPTNLHKEECYVLNVTWGCNFKLWGHFLQWPLQDVTLDYHILNKKHKQL